MGLLGVEGNLAWFCNLDSQERLCELVEEPGFKSRSGEVSFPASCGLPSWWPADAHAKVPKRQGKRRGSACPTPPASDLLGGGRRSPQIRKGYIHELLSQNQNSRPYSKLERAA